MSQIVIEIPIEALTKANVAKALTELTLALGGHASAPAAPAPAAPRPVAIAAPAAPAAPAPAPVKGRPGRKPKAATAPAAPAPAAPAPGKGRPGRKPKSAAAAPAAAAPAPKASSTAAEKWRAYVATLPENSRRFLELLEKQGKLTVNEAVEKLNLPGPKAMGGLTGAMARWAPQKGIEIPYEARESADGTRYWVWKGVK